MKRVAALALGSLTLLLSGCVAAAVIPFAAGAALSKSPAVQGKPVPNAPPPAAATASDRSDLKVVPTGLTALPPPDPRASYGNPALTAFRSYALAQAGLGPGASQRTSAILPAASELRTVRTGCGALPSAVFVDLDPGRGTFDPLAPGEPDPALAPALTELRARGVTVVWFSRLGANFADAARAALAAAQLDPAGGDELVLLSDLGERKQSLRGAVAKRLCPIAMLGDERADFDELYLYLRKPDAAVGLELMIGKGWFLASPFVERPANSGATP